MNPLGPIYSLTVTWKPRQEMVLEQSARISSVEIDLKMICPSSVGYDVFGSLPIEWQNSPHEHELLFIREHGPSGTWSAEEARRN